MKLLLVDDDADFRRIISDSAPPWLNLLAYGSTREATRHLTETACDFDVALIDVHMEQYLGASAEVEGIALLRWMREHGHEEPAFLVSSSPEFVSTDAKAPRSRIVLRKPVSLANLYDFLEALERLFAKGS